MKLENWGSCEETQLSDTILGFPCEMLVVNPRVNNFLILPEIDSFNNQLEVYIFGFITLDLISDPKMQQIE